MSRTFLWITTKDQNISRTLVSRTVSRMKIEQTKEEEFSVMNVKVLGTSDQNIQRFSRNRRNE